MNILTTIACYKRSHGCTDASFSSCLSVFLSFYILELIAKSYIYIFIIKLQLINTTTRPLF